MFRSDAALNLHNVLYSEAWAQQSAASGRDSGAQAVPGDLALRGVPGYQETVDYYRRELINRDLLFDESMRQLSALLVGRAGSAPAGWDGVFTPLLDHYRDMDWPDHQARNLVWAEQVIAGLTQLLPEVIARLEEVFCLTLPDRPVLVSTVLVGRTGPAYTDVHPTHIICSSSHRKSQGLAAVEVVLHEACHSLAEPLLAALSSRVDPTHPQARELWHVVMFYLVGEVVAEAWARHGVDYQPYLNATGLFERAWPMLREPVRDACSSYLDGTSGWDATWDRLAESLHK